MKNTIQILMASVALLGASSVQADNAQNTGASWSGWTNNAPNPINNELWEQNTKKSYYSSLNGTPSSDTHVSTDSEITQQVRNNLKNENSLSDAAKALVVKTDNGVVTLTGIVKNQKELQAAESIVKNTKGVKSVVSDVKTAVK